MQVLFLIWCFIPIENNGSMYVYSRFVRPVFLKNRSNIDNVINSGVGTVTGLAGKALNAGNVLCSLICIELNFTHFYSYFQLKNKSE